MKSKGYVGILCAIALVGCMTHSGQVVSDDASRTTTVTDLAVTDLSDSTQIVIKADGPLNYTAFKLEEPIELVVDMANTKWGPVTDRRDVKLDPITAVVPEQSGDKASIARLSVLLSKSTDYRIHRDNDGKALVIDVAKGTPADLAAAPPPAAPPVVQEVPAEPPAIATPVAAAQGSPSVAAPVSGPAQITAVRIAPQQADVELFIEADRRFTTPRVFSVGNDRLAIDIPDVVTAVKLTPIKASDNPLVKQVRIGQHRDPTKVRIVLDLKTPVRHVVEERDNIVTIRLSKVKSSPEVPVRTVKAPEAQAPVSAAVAPVAAASPSPESPAGAQPPVKLAQAESAEPQASQTDSAPPAEAEPPTSPGVTAVTSDEAAGPTSAPSPKTVGRNGYSGQKISLDFQDADVSNVLRLVADVSGLNMVVGEEVKGKVTLKLFNVPWDQALDIILKSKGLGQVREGNIIRIDTNANIAKQQDEEAKAKEAQVKAEDLKTLILPINYAKATDLSATLKKHLSSRGELTINDATNSLIAKDVPENIADMQQLVKLLDLPTPQVLIETRIVQANTNFARDLGIQWGFATKGSSGPTQFGLNAGPSPTDSFNAQVPGFAVNLPASGTAGPIGNVGVTVGRLTGKNPFALDLRLSAGEAVGETKIISSPRVVTLDNKEAVIQQGDQVPFETVSQNGTQTIFVDATLNLTVTPHITPNGSVVMKIKATKNAIGDFRSGTGQPSISKREASTEVMVQDGETTVIGGIIETSKATSTSGIPWLYKIPVVGWLFKRDSVSDTNQELLIFITPSIVKKT